MAGALDDQLSLQIGQHALELVDALGSDQAGDNGVFRTGNEERGLVDLRILPGRRQLPIAVEVAIPVQPATKTGFAEGFSEIGKVSLAEPGWQRLLRVAVAEEALALLHEHCRGGIGKAPPAEHDAHGARDVVLELGLGNAGRLEILPIEIADAALAQEVERLAAAAERRRHAQASDRREDVGPE